MKIQINKAPPVVEPPDTFTFTGTLDELSAIKTFAEYYSIHAYGVRGAGAAHRLFNSITQVQTYRWNDSSKLFLKDE